MEQIKKAPTLRLKDEKKMERLKKVRRAIAAVEDRDLSDVGLLDEILEEGLAMREQRKDLEQFLKQINGAKA